MTGSLFRCNRQGRDLAGLELRSGMTIDEENPKARRLGFHRNGRIARIKYFMGDAEALRMQDCGSLSAHELLE